MHDILYSDISYEKYVFCRKYSWIYDICVSKYDDDKSLILGLREFDEIDKFL